MIKTALVIVGWLTVAYLAISHGHYLEGALLGAVAIGLCREWWIVRTLRQQLEQVGHQPIQHTSPASTESPTNEDHIVCQCPACSIRDEVAKEMNELQHLRRTEDLPKAQKILEKIRKTNWPCFKQLRAASSATKVEKHPPKN